MKDPAFVFAHHTVDADQAARIEAVRLAAIEFARVLEESTPPCADQSAAARHLRECVWTANCAIATNGRAT